jgi:hypothetical protein
MEEKASLMMTLTTTEKKKFTLDNFITELEDSELQSTDILCL